LVIIAKILGIKFYNYQQEELLKGGEDCI